MTKSLQAIFENGVLRPLEPLHLHDRQQVTLAILDDTQTDPLLDGELAGESPDADQQITLEDVRNALTKITGSLAGDFVAERDER